MIGMRRLLAATAIASGALLALTLLTAPAAVGGAPGSPGAAAVPRPLGTVQQVNATTLRVTNCAGVSQPATAEIRVGNATAGRRGVIALFTGGNGMTFWGDASSVSAQAIADLRASGFRVVEVRWTTPWLASAPGERSGPHALACRPASVTKWLHDTMYVPMGLNPPVGICGFCISGNSGGATQSSYSLTFYGLEAVLDAVVPTGGPPHASLDKGCLRRPGEEAYYFAETGSARTIDSSYGFSSGGPCELHNSGLTSRWIADSVQAGDLHYPASRVHIIGNGRLVGEVHGIDYYNAITSTMKTNEVIPSLPHGVHTDPLGTAAILRALTKTS